MRIRGSPINVVTFPFASILQVFISFQGYLVEKSFCTASVVAFLAFATNPTESPILSQVDAVLSVIFLFIP